jgi:putative ABC transport system permease protein
MLTFWALARPLSMPTAFQDLRFGARMLRQSPSFTIAAVLCLALGIGGTTAIFSVVYAVLLRPLPYAHPEQLARVYTEFPTFPGGGLRKFWTSDPEYLDLKKYTQSWQSLDAWASSGVNISGATEPVRATVAYVTGGLLDALGVKPARGRLFTSRDDEDGAPLTAVIGYGLWQRAFGGDPNITGKDIQFNNKKCTVIGVMPPGFEFPPGEVDRTEIWAPLQLDPAHPGSRGGHYLYLLGRLRPGVSLENARSETAQLVTHFQQNASPKTHTFSTVAHPIVMFALHDEVVGAVRPAMWAMLGAVGFVLLIACVNVANLLLARAEARQREIAVRKALGAGLFRLVRQFVAEGVLLSVSGAALGLLLAFAGVRLIAIASAGSIPRASEIGLNAAVLLFAVTVSIATGIAFGLAPLGQIAGRGVAEALKATGLRTTASVTANRFRGVLVAAELALALMLLIGTGLMLRAFWNLQQVNIGLNASNMLTVNLALPRASYSSHPRAQQFWESVSHRVASLPTVVSASFMTGLPPVRPVNANDTNVEGFVPRKNGPIQNIDYYQTVGDRFFETMRIPLIEGRYFDARDGENAPLTLVVNQTLARTFWPGESALGHRMSPSFSNKDEWRTIVGVIADVKNAGVDKPTGTELYIPFRQDPSLTSGAGYLAIRTTGDPRALVNSVRREVADVDSSLPLSKIRTMEEVVSAANSRPRFLTLLLSLFAGVALVLAAIGLYGVISYTVAQRTNEFGIRMALGAGPLEVLRLVMKRGLQLALVGIALGAAGAFALALLLRGLVFGIGGFDPATFLAMAALLGFITLLACYFPARRATKVDPMTALRYE